MHLNELEPGDIIFLIRQFSEDTSRAPYFDHVVMFLDFKEDKPLIMHATDQPPKKLCVSCLEAHDGQDENGDLYHTQFCVYRCRDTVLASHAAHQLFAWTPFDIPYDFNRLDQLLAQEEDAACDPKVLLQKSKQQYFSQGFFRAIKFSARRGTAATHVEADKLGKGLICTSAVVLAYQVSELVSYMRSEKYSRVSDKYGNISMIPSDRLREDYIRYVQTLQKERPQSGHDQYTPSILALMKQDLDPYALNSCLQVDSKCLSCTALARYLSEASERWDCLGTIHEESVNLLKKESAFALAKG